MRMRLFLSWKTQLIDPSSEPIDFLELYLTKNIYELIVRETNRFAQQYLDSHPEQAQNHYLKAWRDVTETKAFLGIIIMMGITHKYSINSYWSRDELLATPVFSQLISRDRFKLILKFLHFNNNATYDANDPNRDRLRKLRPFLDMIRERFKTFYQPGKKPYVLFKGRLHFRQYINTKRARFGIKLYELTTSEGITLDLLVYCGKGMYYAKDDQYENMATTERIPTELMRPFYDRGHVFYTDNFYTSPTLAKNLLERKTYLCGTIKKSRKNYCSEIQHVALQKVPHPSTNIRQRLKLMVKRKSLPCLHANIEQRKIKQAKSLRLYTCFQPFTIL